MRSTSSCGFAQGTAFSRDGRWLAVGDLRRACLFALPSLRLVARTPFIRPRWPVDDDLQNLSALEFLEGDTVLFVRTSDGSAGLARIPQGTFFWKGRGELRAGATPGTHAVLDQADGQIIVAIGPGQQARAGALDAAERELGAPIKGLAADPSVADQAMRKELQTFVCQIGPWLFPLPACDGP